MNIQNSFKRILYPTKIKDVNLDISFHLMHYIVEFGNPDILQDKLSSH